jgi:hypothetical protein
MSDLAWHKAAGVLRLTADKRAAGWPEAFKIGELAWLQYPPEGTAEQRVSARRRRIAFEAAIKGAIAAGTLRSVSTVEQHTKERLVGYLPPFRFNVPSGVSSRNVARYERVQHEVTVIRITRAEFARWWAQQRETASEHIEAWLDSGNEHRTTLVTPGKGAAPEKWNRGLKLVAWECAKALKEADGAITGVALWNAMVVDERVQKMGDSSLKFISTSTALTGGEVLIKSDTVRKDWRKHLEQLLS